MKRIRERRSLSSRLWTVALIAGLLVCPCDGRASDVFDLVRNVIDAPQFKGKDPITCLGLAAELVRAGKVKQTDMAFMLLDWGDRYLREPGDPLERLRRWAKLNSDETLSRLKIPRDYLNRMILAEYLVRHKSYLKATPEKKLEIVSTLERENLVDWSVALAYARLYAGAIISGATAYKMPRPSESLITLKKLKDRGLVGWHYRVPTEAVLVAETLALDSKFQKAGPRGRLVILKGLETQELITAVTRKELEKLPVWRLLVSDPGFLKADPEAKRALLAKLKSDGLISASTCSDLEGIFRPPPPATAESAPSPPPDKIVPKGSPLKVKDVFSRPGQKSP